MPDPDADPARPATPIRGRGALSNQAGRYEERVCQAVDDGWGRKDDAAPERPVTRVQFDASRSVISRNDSPDVPFSHSINPYRGCEHGCIYCYARPSHAWLGMSPGLDFETRLVAKPNAPALLEKALGRPGYRCETLAMGTNTDPYQPLERRLKITRDLIRVLAEHRHPLSIVTKSALIERDVDLLAPMAEQGLVIVHLSVATLERPLARRMEPRAAAPQRRLQTVARLRAAGIPVGLLAAPVIPGLTDDELEAVLGAAAAAGAQSAGYVMLRLPGEVAELFREWLEGQYPLKAARVMALVRSTRGGRDNDPAFGRRMRGSGQYAAMIGQRFRLAAQRLGLAARLPRPDTSRFRVPGQLF